MKSILVLLAPLVLSSSLVGANPALVPLEASPVEEIPLNCPLEGVFGYPHPKACEEYFQCTNGTLTHEYCPNGLLYSETGHVVGFCAYYWNVDCKGKTIPKPISSPGCPYQFGFFAEEHNAQCNVFYSECSWGIPSQRQCEPHGLFYDERIKGCNWPDQVGCSSESLLNFKCPDEDKANRYWPYPRYYYNQASIITCVTGQPRLVNCGADELVDSGSLTCQPIHKESKEESVVHKRRF